jgi:hypothetical protein
MATVTDTLETVLRLIALDTFLAGFAMMTKFIGQATDAFVQYDDAILRTQFLLEQFGHAMPLGEISEFTRQLSLTTGQLQTDIANTEAYLTRFKVSGQDMEHALRVLADTAGAVHAPLQEISKGLEMARAGHAREFFSTLGIQVRGVEGQLLSMNAVLTILEQHFGGFTEKMEGTLPMAMRKTAAAFQDMQIALGELFGPATLRTLELLQGLFEGIANAAREIGTFFGVQMPELSHALSAGSENRRRVEGYLEQITTNTGPQGALAHALLSGGSFSQPGGGLVIRDFNTQFKTGTGSR